MELTKEEAIKRHRILWNWIAEETKKQKRCVCKDEAFEHFGWDKCESYCWCCEYASMLVKDMDVEEKLNRCKYCPILWARNVTEKCTDDWSLFEQWTYYVGIHRYKNAASLARRIAFLPERGKIYNLDEYQKG